MRILFVSNLYPPVTIGGYEWVCHDVAEGLRARGHDIHILTTTLYRHGKGEGDPPHIHRRLQLKAHSRLAELTADSVVHANRVASQVHNVRAARRVLEQIRPEAIMVWNGNELGRGLLTAIERHHRVSYYLHDPWLTVVLAGHRRSWPRRLARSTFDRALQPLGVPTGGIRGTDLIFVSHALKAQYARLGADVRDGAVLYNTITTDLFPFRPQHLLRRAPEEPYRILYAGQIAPEKGITTLITALHKIRATPGFDQTRLALTGAPPKNAYGEAVTAHIHEYGLAEAIDFLPRRPRSAMAALFAEHDLLAFPSEWEEPFALTLLEAMASGLPVVSTLTGGSAELIRDGENALAFRAGDPDHLAQRLIEALAHPERTAAIGVRASDEIRAYYRFETQLAAIESHLGALLAAPAPPSRRR